MDNLTLGQKIRNFRVRAGLSQMELENKIEASVGAISRIENGKVNPTKETLLKIIDALELKSHQVASLYNISPNSLASIINLTTKVVKEDNLTNILQTSVNEIAYDLDLLGAFLCLKKDNEIWCETYTKTFFTQIVDKLIPKPFSKHHIPIKGNEENLVVKTILTRQPQTSFKLKDYSYPFFSANLSNIVEKLTTFKSGLSFPLYFEDKTYGMICYGKSYKDDFSEEYEILESFSHYLGVIINKYFNNG